MGKFLAKYADETGRVRETIFEAPSDNDLRAALEARGFFVLETTVQRQTVGEFLREYMPFEKGVSLRELVEFIKLLRTMLKAGLPLNESLELLFEETPPGPLAQAVGDVRKDIREGSSFSRALARHPKVFPEIFVRTVIAGEKAGALETVLHRLVGYFSTVMAVRRKVIGALIYPSVLLLVCLCAVTYLIVNVVPEFTNLFASLDAPIPWFTKIVLGLSGLVGQFFLPLTIIFFVGGYLLVRFSRTTVGRRLVDAWKLRVPLVGRLEELFALSQFSRTLATLLEGGIPLVEGLSVVLESLENRAIAERFCLLRTSLERGESFAKALRQVPNTPSMVTRIVHVGEESGQLGPMLGNLADYFDEEINNLTSTMTSLIEPILFLSMAVVVGALIIAILMPVLTAASNIR